MVSNIVLILFYLFSPLLILYLCHRIPFLNKAGTVLVAYAIGLLFGNLGILGPGMEKTQEAVSSYSVVFALPLLLFSLNLKQWIRLAGKTALSMLAAILGVLIIIIAGYFVFGSQLDDTWKVSGMLVGVYTGGTPNLASIRSALDVDPEIYILTHTYDMLISAVYILFLITIGRKVFGTILKPFKKNKQQEHEQASIDDKSEAYWTMFRKPFLLPYLKAAGISLIIVVIGGGIGMLFSENYSDIVSILLITSLGILASFIKPINALKNSFNLGMYFILVFSVAVASLADIRQFTEISYTLLLYVSIVVLGGLIFHALISALFKVDRDTMIITSTALICSPPFVPVVAGALKNKALIVSGLTVGIVGYAIGNYLGVMIAYFLRNFPF